MKKYEVMLKIGGKRWQKADMDRVYIDAAAADDMYFDLDDDKKSHGRLPINRREKQAAKIWVDVKTDEINVTGTSCNEEVAACIAELINANQPEEKEEEATMERTAAYDIKANRDITIEVSGEIRRTVLNTDYTLAQLREGADFENRYMKLWDRFLDGNNLYADGVEYLESSCDGYTVRFERDAKIVEEAE